MTPEQWVAANEAMEKRHRKESKEMLRQSERLEIPPISELRKATASDIVVGAVIYYPDRENPFWQAIETVQYPDDDFKAYTAQDGCRYGLDGAHVRKGARP